MFVTYEQIHPHDAFGQVMSMWRPVPALALPPASIPLPLLSLDVLLPKLTCFAEPSVELSTIGAPSLPRSTRAAA